MVWRQILVGCGSVEVRARVEGRSSVFGTMRALRPECIRTLRSKSRSSMGARSKTIGAMGSETTGAVGSKTIRALGSEGVGPTVTARRKV